MKKSWFTTAFLSGILLLTGCQNGDHQTNIPIATDTSAADIHLPLGFSVIDIN